ARRAHLPHPTLQPPHHAQLRHHVRGHLRQLHPLLRHRRPRPPLHLPQGTRQPRIARPRHALQVRQDRGPPRTHPRRTPPPRVTPHHSSPHRQPHRRPTAARFPTRRHSARRRPPPQHQDLIAHRLHRRQPPSLARHPRPRHRCRRRRRRHPHARRVVRPHRPRTRPPPHPPSPARHLRELRQPTPVLG